MADDSEDAAKKKAAEDDDAGSANDDAKSDAGSNKSGSKKSGSSKSGGGSGSDNDDPAPAPAPKPALQFQSTLKSATLHVSRTQLLEYMSAREWWRKGQGDLIFTALLWSAFVVLMYLRSNAELSFVVQDALMQRLGDIRAHPSISGVILTNRGQGPTQCSCACKSTSRGPPQSACDSDAEVLEFMGDLPSSAQASLQSGACQDMYRPLALFGDIMGPGSSGWTCPEWAYFLGGIGASGCSAESVMASPNCGAECRDFFEQDPQSMRWRCPGTCGYCAERSEAETRMETVSLDSIAAPGQAWFWVEHGLLPDVWGGVGSASQTGRPAGPLVGRNVIIGGIRARQHRASTLDDCQVSEGLEAFYQPRCRSKEPASGAYGPPGSYSFQPMSNGEEGVYEAVFDVERNATDALALARYLRTNNWLDSATRSFHLDALLLNAEANLYVLLYVDFVFAADGGVEKSIHVRTFQALAGKLSFMDYIPELAWLLLIVLLLRQELVDLLFECWHRRCKEYFHNPWNLVDWGSVLLGFAMAWYYYVIALLTTGLSEDVIALPRRPLPAGIDVAQYRSDWSAVVDSAAQIHELRGYLQLCLFWYTTVITLRFLKGFQGQAKLAMIQKGLSSSFDDVTHFMIPFITMFTNFVLGGRILFGSELEDWTRFDKAAGALVRLMLGNLDFQEMYEVAPVSATVWFWLFLLCMVFVFMNLLTAIMVDHFCSVRSQLGHTVSVATDIRRAWKDFLWRCEWRWENFKDAEYSTVLSNPYADVIDELLAKVKATDEMEMASRQSGIGLRLHRRKAEDTSAHALEGPGGQDLTALELRQMGPDPMTAEHLLEECDIATNEDGGGIRQQSKLMQVRFFVKLLARHKAELNKHCEQLEHGAEEDYGELAGVLDRLEESIVDAISGFQVLKHNGGVDSLALVPPTLDFAGTSLRDTFQSRLAIQPPRTLKGPGVIPPVPPETLRQAGRGGSAPALADDAYDATRAQGPPTNQALADRAGNLAIVDGFDD